MLSDAYHEYLIHMVKHLILLLDNTGKADGEDTMEQIRATLKAQQVSLEMAAPSLARDFFTEEEMVTFAFYCMILCKG